MYDVWERRNAYKISVRKSEVKILLWRSSNRCENNIEMYLRETLLEDSVQFNLFNPRIIIHDMGQVKHVDWIQLAQDRVQLWALVNMIMHLQVT
jgi:hypothetical protein